MLLPTQGSLFVRSTVTGVLIIDIFLSIPLAKIQSEIHLSQGVVTKDLPALVIALAVRCDPG